MNRVSEVEVSVLRGLAEGLQSKEIALRLGRSRATIEFHIRVLYGKLDARSRAQLVARAFEQKLFEAAMDHGRGATGWAMPVLASLTLAAVLVGTGAAPARADAPSAAHAVTNADRVRTDRAREWLRRLQTGDVDRSQLTPQLNTLLGPGAIQAAVSEDGPLGEPLEFTYVSKRRQGGGTTIYVYRVRFASATMAWWFGTDAQGKISALLLNRAAS